MEQKTIQTKNGAYNGRRWLGFVASLVLLVAVIMFGIVGIGESVKFNNWIFSDDISSGGYSYVQYMWYAAIGVSGLAFLLQFIGCLANKSNIMTIANISFLLQFAMSIAVYCLLIALSDLNELYKWLDDGFEKSGLIASIVFMAISGVLLIIFLIGVIQPNEMTKKTKNKKVVSKKDKNSKNDVLEQQENLVDQNFDEDKPSYIDDPTFVDPTFLNGVETQQEESPQDKETQPLEPTETDLKSKMKHLEDLLYLKPQDINMNDIDSLSEGKKNDVINNANQQELDQPYLNVNKFDNLNVFENNQDFANDNQENFVNNDPVFSDNSPISNIDVNINQPVKSNIPSWMENNETSDFKSIDVNQLENDLNSDSEEFKPVGQLNKDAQKEISQLYDDIVGNDKKFEYKDNIFGAPKKETVFNEPTTSWLRKDNSNVTNPKPSQQQQNVSPSPQPEYNSVEGPRTIIPRRLNPADVKYKLETSKYDQKNKVARRKAVLDSSAANGSNHYIVGEQDKIWKALKSHDRQSIWKQMELAKIGLLNDQSTIPSIENASSYNNHNSDFSQKIGASLDDMTTFSTNDSGLTKGNKFELLFDDENEDFEKTLDKTIDEHIKALNDIPASDATFESNNSDINDMPFISDFEDEDDDEKNLYHETIEVYSDKKQIDVIMDSRDIKNANNSKNETIDWNGNTY